jgi:Cu/Ag efflux protein CusF
MRKAMFWVLLGVIAIVFMAPIVMADETAAPKEEGAAEKPAAAKKGKLSTVKGEVLEIDSAANTLKIKETSKKSQENREVTVNINDRTMITAGKTKKSLADVKEGDKVLARVTEEDGKMTARSIRIGGGVKGMKKKEAAPKAPEAPATQ